MVHLCKGNNGQDPELVKHEYILKIDQSILS